MSYVINSLSGDLIILINTNDLWCKQGLILALQLSGEFKEVHSAASSSLKFFKYSESRSFSFQIGRLGFARRGKPIINLFPITRIIS